MMFEDWYGLREDDRVLHAGAFNWTYTLGTGLMDPWTRGATAIIPAPGTASEDLPNLLRTQKATIFAAAPGVYRQMLKRADCQGLVNLRHGLSAGETLAPELAQKWRDATGREVLQAYGMTECSTFISQRPHRKTGSAGMGRPQRGRRVAVVENGAPVPRGTEGTIAISRRDPGLMLGYIGAAEETEKRMSGEWFLTGDRAVMEESGDLMYMGRNDDMMNAGGYRVSPLEVESVLGRVEGIDTVAVTDVEVKENTTVIAAFYTGPVALDDALLQQHVSRELARYKHPRMFVHLPELPVGPNGKILRRELRNRFRRQT
jgi:acyl-coenzyme A synthetase/AMP-(fatty) acid ligase